MTDRLAGRALVDGDRHQSYGDSGVMMARIAKTWSGVCGFEITPTQVALCMAALKLVREGYQHGDDNLTDAHGYLEIAARLQRAGQW